MLQPPLKCVSAQSTGGARQWRQAPRVPFDKPWCRGGSCPCWSPGLSPFLPQHPQSLFISVPYATALLASVRAEWHSYQLAVAAKAMEGAGVVAAAKARLSLTKAAAAAVQPPAAPQAATADLQQLISARSRSAKGLLAMSAAVWTYQHPAVARARLCFLGLSTYVGKGRHGGHDGAAHTLPATGPHAHVVMPCKAGPVLPPCRVIPLLSKYLPVQDVLTLGCVDRRCRAVHTLPLVYLHLNLSWHVDLPRLTRLCTGLEFGERSPSLATPVGDGAGDGDDPFIGPRGPLGVARPRATELLGHAVRFVTIRDVDLDDDVLAAIVRLCPNMESLDVQAELVSEEFAPLVRVRVCDGGRGVEARPEQLPIGPVHALL